MARLHLLRGQSVWVIRVDRNGDITLQPTMHHEISGEVDPATWRYTVELARPSGEPVVRNVPASGIIHLRNDPEPEAPMAWHLASYQGRPYCCPAGKHRIEH